MSNFHDPEIDRTHQAALRSISRVVDETAVPTPPARALREVCGQLERSPAMVLTGAGVSTGSGIPDYRSAGGRLRTGRPMTYQEFKYDQQASHRYWARGFVGWNTMKSVQPNRTHYALVELENAGMVTGVVTQNVDGLHSAAGTRRLVTLHGNMDFVVCLSCGYEEDRPHFDARTEELNPGYRESIIVDKSMINPDGDVTLDSDTVGRFRMPGCERCGSIRLKPDVVYFGEAVPRNRRAQAESLFNDSDSLLVAGSSLAVMSGYRFVLEAKKQGKRVSVINGGPGRGDTKADTLWRTRVEGAFDSVLDGLGL